MTEQENPSSAATLPQGRLFRLKELPGWLAKRISIPPGRIGIALGADGSARTFPPGEHTLLSAWQRIRGQGVGLQAGYVPDGEFTARFPLHYLLSGDGQLLDLSLTCSLDLNDPARFFREVLIPRGELRALTLDLDAQPLGDALGAITTQYAAADLVHGVADARLFSQARASLGAVLANQGLQVREILLLTVSRSENRALIAEKAQALAERLQEVEIQKKMAEVENQAQMEDFLRQMAPELAQLSSVRVAEEAKPAAEPVAKGQKANAFQDWLKDTTAPASEKKRPWRLENLFQRKPEPTSPQKPRHPAFWWLPRVLWVIFAITVACILTIVVDWVAAKASVVDRLSIQMGIWSFVIISVILESARALYEKRETFSEDEWIRQGYQHLENLVGNDRQWADEVVRQQCASELLHVHEILSEIRSLEYKRGQTALALRLKNELERNAQDCAEKIQRRDYGQPPYVTDLRLSEQNWLRMLDNDEDLLDAARALGKQADLLQQHAHHETLTDKLLSEMNAGIAQFSNRFFERGHLVQMPASQTTR